MADPTTIQWATLAVSGVAAIGATASAVYAVKAQRRNSDRERLRPELERLATELHRFRLRMVALGEVHDQEDVQAALEPTIEVLQELQPLLEIYDFQLGDAVRLLERVLVAWALEGELDEGVAKKLPKQVWFISDRISKILR